MKKQQQPHSDNQGQGDNQGEGNRDADRHYREATRDFVESGRVDEAARDADPRSSEEAEDLRRAEDIGRSHAKEEDPAVKRTERRR